MRIMASTQVDLYEAKTQLSSLVERAAKGEEIIIAKAGKPVARLIPIKSRSNRPRNLYEWLAKILSELPTSPMISTIFFMSTFCKTLGSEK